MALELMMEDASRVGSDIHQFDHDGCINLVLDNFNFFHPNMVSVSYVGKGHSIIDKRLKFSKEFCEYIFDEQFSRQLDEPFISRVNSLSLTAFFCYCFDNKFQAKFTKPFTISNYMQKLINELENSSFNKDHDNFKKLLREVAKFANHHRGDSNANEIYTTVLAHYIDPRIVIGFCMRNNLDYLEYYPLSRISIIGGWFNDWMSKNNIDQVKNFRYHQESLFLNYKSVADII
jgi:hypothetical protein